MAFNRLVDRRMDAENPRTADRHLPRARVGGECRSVLSGRGRWFCGLDAVVSAEPLAAVALAAGAGVPVRLFVRQTLHGPVPLLAGGRADAFAGLHVDRTAREVTWPPVLLGLAILFWVGGFDVIYACQDTEFDKSRRLHSIPARARGSGRSQARFREPRPHVGLPRRALESR